MQITIINDCQDQNAKLRQISRAGSLFERSSVNCFGVKCELEAAGFLLDAIDAFEGRKGVIIVNVAPRNGKARKWKNGAPFGFFWYKKTLIVSSVDGLVLSLAKEFGLITQFYILDIEEVLNRISLKEIDAETKTRIKESQFRSFDFLPRAACWIYQNKKIPKASFDVSKIEPAPKAIWFVDNFGNIKTTLTKNDLCANKSATIRIGNSNIDLKFYDRLRDVPDKEIGLTCGSSGVGNRRFLEIAIQGDNAAKAFGIKKGDKIEIV